MELIDIGELPAELALQLSGEEADPWDSARNPGLRFRPKTSHVAARADDGTLIAVAGLVLADLEAGEMPLAVVGIGGVIVNHAHRGTGLARIVIDAALRRAQTMGPALALLFCLPDRAGLYERLGFVAVSAPVIVPQPAGPIEIPLVTMWRGLVPSARWPPGTVRLADLPF